MALPGRNRLAAGKDIDEVFKLGKAARGSFLLIKYVFKGVDGVRVAVAVPTSIVKGAVSRNRIKRLLFEAIRPQINFLQKGSRVVVVAQKGILLEDRASIGEEVALLLEKAKLKKT